MFSVFSLRVLLTSIKIAPRSKNNTNMPKSTIAGPFSMLAISPEEDILEILENISGVSVKKATTTVSGNAKMLYIWGK